MFDTFLRRKLKNHTFFMETSVDSTLFQRKECKKVIFPPNNSQSSINCLVSISVARLEMTTFRATLDRVKPRYKSLRSTSPKFSKSTSVKITQGACRPLKRLTESQKSSPSVKICFPSLNWSVGRLSRYLRLPSVWQFSISECSRPLKVKMAICSFLNPSSWAASMAACVCFSNEPFVVPYSKNCGTLPS